MHPIQPLNYSTSNAWASSMEMEHFDGTATTNQAAGAPWHWKNSQSGGKCWQGYFPDQHNDTFGIFEAAPRRNACDRSPSGYSAKMTV